MSPLTLEDIERFREYDLVNKFKKIEREYHEGKLNLEKEYCTVCGKKLKIGQDTCEHK